MSLADIAQPTVRAGAAVLRRMQRASGTLLFTESKADRDVARAEARRAAANGSAALLYGMATSAFDARQAGARAHPSALVHRFYRDRYGKYVKYVCCVRCENASRLIYRLSDDRPREFEHSAERGGWLCHACVRILAALDAHPEYRLLRCRLFVRPRPTARPKPRRVPLQPYRRRSKPCRVIPIARRAAFQSPRARVSARP